MFDVLTLTPTQRPADPAATLYTGPERRRSHNASVAHRWLAHMLDEIDYGMVLLDAEMRVLHINHVARFELNDEHPLQILGNQLRARRSEDVAPLHAALAGSAVRHLRRLLTLGGASTRISLAVVPLPAMAPDVRAATLLILGKRQVCADLSVQWFAQTHGLSVAEGQVLAGLCAGRRPSDIATGQRVAMSTVRTQISSIRAKTGAESIRSLVRQVAVLPPLVGTLGRARSGLMEAC